jgi:hypothetical protein
VLHDFVCGVLHDFASVLKGVQGGKVMGCRAGVEVQILNPQPLGWGSTHALGLGVNTCLWDSRDRVCIEIRAHLRENVEHTAGWRDP